MAAQKLNGGRLQEFAVQSRTLNLSRPYCFLLTDDLASDAQIWAVLMIGWNLFLLSTLEIRKRCFLRETLNKAFALELILLGFH